MGTKIFVRLSNPVDQDLSATPFVLVGPFTSVQQHDWALHGVDPKTGELQHITSYSFSSGWWVYQRVRYSTMVVLFEGGGLHKFSFVRDKMIQEHVTVLASSLEAALEEVCNVWWDESKQETIWVGNWEEEI